MPSRFTQLLTTIAIPNTYGNLSPDPTSPDVFYEDFRDGENCYPGMSGKASSSRGKMEPGKMAQGKMAHVNLMEGERGERAVEGVESVRGREDGVKAERVRGRRRQSLKDAAGLLVFWKREERPKSPERERTWMGYRGRENTREVSRPPTRETNWTSREARHSSHPTPTSSRPPSRVRCLPDMPPATPPEPPPKDTPPEKKRSRASSISSFRSGISSRLRKEMPVVVPPPMGLGVKGERNGRHDSSFSSVSSSFEEKRNSSRSSRRSSRPPPDGLSFFQLQSLGALLQELQRGLEKHEEVVGAFERNLLYLLAMKERGIKDNIKLNSEWKRGLCRELGICREELGRVFSRKNTIHSRSSELVRGLLARLEEPTPSRPTSRKHGYLSHFRDHSQSRSRPPLSHKKHQSNPAVAHVVSDAITKEVVNQMLDALKKDMESQRQLNDCILDAITRKCWKTRWVRSANMRIEMRRFVGFVGGRVTVVKDVEFGIKASMGLITMMLDGEGQRDVSRAPSKERGLGRGKETRRFSWR